MPRPGSTTGYDVNALRAAYGPAPVVRRCFEKADASELVAAADRGALGGARVVTRRERDGAAHSANVRGDDAEWDVPGGGRDDVAGDVARGRDECLAFAPDAAGER